MARIGTNRFRHGGRVTSVDFSPDGKLVVSGGEDGYIRLWDAASGKELYKTSRGRAGFCGLSWSHHLTFSPDGKSVAFALDTAIVIWDTEDTDEDQTSLKFGVGYQEHPYVPVHEVAYSPDGKTLASGNGDHTLRLWDAATGREIRKLVGHGGPVYSVAFSPDGKVLASGSQDGALRLWDATTGKGIQTLQGHGEVYTIRFSSDGKTLASGNGDHTLRLWDAATGKEIRKLVGHGGPVYSVAFSPDGKVLASGSQDGTLRLWDATTGDEIRKFEGRRSLSSFSFSPDGSLLVWGDDYVLRLCRVDSGEEIRMFEGHVRRITLVVSSPGGKLLASASEDHTLRLWNPQSGQAIHKLEGHESPVTSAAFSPDGKLLVSGSEDHTLRLWDSATGREIRRFAGHQGIICSVALSPDGRLLVSGSEDGTLRVWERAAGREIFSLEGHEGEVTSVAFSPDGKTLVSGGEDHTLRLWDAATGKEIRKLEGHGGPVYSVGFSPNGKLLALGGDPVRLVDVSTEEEILRFERQDQAGIPERGVFSPDGRAIALEYSNCVLLCDASTGREIRRLEGLRNARVSFLPDGASMAVVADGFNMTALVWSLAPIGWTPTVDPTTAQLEGWWRQLTSGDAPATYRALWDLASAGTATVRLLQQQSKPVERRELDSLVARLDEDDPVERERAVSELIRAAPPGQLRDEMTLTGRSAQARALIQEALDAVEAREGRAIQVLERIGTKAAVDELKKMAGEDARAALERLRRRESAAR
jgi:WD40 repeat protein